MSSKLRALFGGEKRRSPETRRSPFAHEDAMGLCLGRDAKPIGRRLGLAGRTVRQWRERFDSDHRGPGETLALTIRAALELGRDEEDAVAPIRALADEFGYELAPRLRIAGTIGLDEANLGLSELLQHAGEYVVETSESIRDERIDSAERARIRRAATRLKEAVAILEQSLDRVAEYPEAAP